MSRLASFDLSAPSKVGAPRLTAMLQYVVPPCRQSVSALTERSLLFVSVYVLYECLVSCWYENDLIRSSERS